MSARGNVVARNNTDFIPVVLVRDLGRGHDAYSEIAAIFANGHDIYELDLLSVDNSEIRDGVTVADWADELERLLDSVPTVSAICIGDNIGSLVVEHFAATRPDRVSHLILLNPLHALPAGQRHAYEERAARITQEGIDVFDDWHVDENHRSPTSSHPCATPRALAAACNAVASAHTSDLQATDAPSLICFDRSQPVHASAAECLRDELPNCTTVAVRSTDGATAAISQFLSTNLLSNNQSEVTP